MIYRVVSDNSEGLFIVETSEEELDEDFVPVKFNTYKTVLH